MLSNLTTISLIELDIKGMVGVTSCSQQDSMPAFLPPPHCHCHHDARVTAQGERGTWDQCCQCQCRSLAWHSWALLYGNNMPLVVAMESNVSCQGCLYNALQWWNWQYCCESLSIQLTPDTRTLTVIITIAVSISADTNATDIAPVLTEPALSGSIFCLVSNLITWHCKRLQYK